MEKPSFYQSLAAGFQGFMHGALAGTAIGMLGGAVMGALFAISGNIPMGAVLGAALVGKMGFSIGGLIGAITGVVQCHEKHAPDPQDVINVANISYAQGVAAGRSQHISEPAKAEVIAASDHFQKQLAAEQHIPGIPTR